jgi:hypothetical protein
MEIVHSCSPTRRREPRGVADVSQLDCNHPAWPAAFTVSIEASTAEVPVATPPLPVDGDLVAGAHYELVTDPPIVDGDLHLNSVAQHRYSLAPNSRP